MKKFIYTTIALAATMFAACSSDDDIQTINDNNKEFTIIAQLPENSTTRMTATDNSSVSTYGMDFAWVENEYIYFYYNMSSDMSSVWSKKTRPAKNISNGTATFTLASGEDPSASGNYLYASKLSLSATDDSKGSDSSTADIAYFYIDCQKWIYDNLTDVGNNNPMFGAVKYTTGTSSYSSTLKFYNVCALLKFDLTLPDGVETITGVDIYGYNTKEENLTFRQNLKVTGSTGIPEFIDDAVTYKTKKEKRNNNHLSVSSKSFSVTSNNITLYAFIIPQSINGLYIKLTDSSSKTYTNYKKFTSPQTLEAGKMYGVKVTKESSWTVTSE